MVAGVLALAAAICSCNKEMTETDAQTTDGTGRSAFLLPTTHGICRRPAHHRPKEPR